MLWSKTASSTRVQHKKLVIKIVILATIMMVFDGCILFYIEPDPPEITCSIEKYNDYSEVTRIDVSYVAGATEYQLYWGKKPCSSDPSTFQTSILRTESGSFFTRKIAILSEAYPNGEGYYYAVKASNSKGTSDFSNVVSNR